MVSQYDGIKKHNDTFTSIIYFNVYFKNKFQQIRLQEPIYVSCTILST